MTRAANMNLDRPTWDVPTRPVLFTVAEFERMCELGFFPDPAKHELWDGQIVFTPLAGPRHADVHSRLMKELILAIDAAGIDERYGVFGNGGLQIGSRNLRWPDLMVGHLPLDTSKRLTGEGVALIVEVGARSTLGDEFGEKRSKYAGAQIPEYWIIDMEHGLLHAFRNPKAGDYPDCVPVKAGDNISPVFAPQITLNVADLV